MKYYKVLCLFVIYLSVFISAQNNMTLENCFKLALKNNIDIIEDKYLPDIAEAQIPLAKSPYDIYLQSGFTYEKTDSRLLQQRRGFFNVGFAKNFLTGTNVFMGYQMEYRRDSELEVYSIINRELGLNDKDLAMEKYWGSGFAINISQPLLKDFGFGPNKAFIEVAKKGKIIADYEVQRKINETLAQVEIAYWNWICMLENKKAIDKSISDSTEYLRLVRRKLGKVDGVTAADEYDALVNLKSREDMNITIEKEIKLAKDSLIRLIMPFNPKNPIEIDWDRNMVPSNDSLTQFGVPQKNMIDNKKSLGIALKTRPELKQIKEQLNSLKILIGKYKNSLLPALNLEGGITLLGERQGSWNAFQDTLDGDHYRWSAGVTFEYPIGNLAAKGQLKKTNTEYNRMEVTYHKAQYDIALQIRMAIHNIEESRKKYEKSVAIFDNADKMLKKREEKYRKPLAGDFNFIFFLQDAEYKRTEALINKNKAVLSYKVAIAQLKMAKAKYLNEIKNKYNIK